MESLLRQVSNEQMKASTVEAKQHDELSNRVVGFATKDTTIAAPAPAAGTGASPSSSTSSVPPPPPPPPVTSPRRVRIMNMMHSSSQNSTSQRQSSFVIRSSQNIFDINRGRMMDRSYVAEVVTGLTEPMNPLERKRREFFGQTSAYTSSTSNLNATTSNRSINNGSKTNLFPGGSWLSSGRDGESGGQSSENRQQVQDAVEPTRNTNQDTSCIMGNHHHHHHHHHHVQYRLRSKTNGHDSEYIASFDPTEKWALTEYINKYIFWSFQANLVVLVASLTAIFFVLTTLFAVVIAASGWIQPDCVYVGSLNFEESGSYFIDAYAISWTTFSTVGYGLTGPSISNVDRCIIVNMFAAIEALFGVLYAGFAGAVLFGRITRINSLANVLWSDPIVVRYGSGVTIEQQRQQKTRHSQKKKSSNNRDDDDNLSHDTEQDNNDGDDDDNDEEANKIPCPILEFRLHNTHFDREGGELANASLNVWASTLADFAPDSIVKAAKLSRKDKRMQKRKSRQEQKQQQREQKRKSLLDRKQKDSNHKNGSKKGDSQAATRSKSPKQKDDKEANEQQQQQMSIQAALEKGREEAIQEVAQILASTTATTSTAAGNAITVSQNHFALSEDPNNKLVPQLIYSKLEIETDFHPFFKRTWTVRHHLNEKSPLLSDQAHERIKANGGYWPTEWNDYASVRKHLKFYEIVATLSGTDNTTANTVYSQKTYDYVDVNIGYRFVSSLVVVDPKTKSLGVDNALINDVLEQYGGGAEPFQNVIAGNATEGNNNLTTTPTTTPGTAASDGEDGNMQDIELGTNNAKACVLSMENEQDTLERKED